MSETYFVINNSEGDTIVKEFTKEKLLEEINDGAWGGDIEYLRDIPDDNDTNYWGGSVLIIKGSIVTPEEKKIVLTHDIK